LLHEILIIKSNLKNMKKSILILITFVAVVAVVSTGCKREGCTDPLANNYDEKAKDDDGSCSYDPITMDHNDWKGDITAEITLDASKVWKLSGLIKVKDGGKLTIPAGTKIEGVGGTSSAIIVEQGGKIFVNGTAAAPVVMTSGLATKARGDWGGLVICGKAPCNSGGGMSEVGDVPYGGTIANDNSGTIRYLRIEYSGAAFNSEKEYNGFSLFGVGNGTTVEYVQIYQCADDPIEFYGGTVHANYIVSVNGEDDMFDWTEGWTGGGQYWYGVITEPGIGNRGFEADNWETDNNATPYANPTISNVTLIGNNLGGNEPQGMELRRGTKGIIDNVVLKNWKIGVRVSGTDSQGFLNGDLKVTNVRFIDCETNISVGTGDPAGITENPAATGAGNADGIPTWAQGWTVGL
jgi:hypothetical protein